MSENNSSELAARELLQLAAKAAGIEIKGYDGSVEANPVIAFTETTVTTWNPLADDGAALRLAVTLDMDVGQGFEMAFANATLLAAPDQEYDEKNDMIKERARLPGERTETLHVEADESYENHGGDKLAATRRAIVRAAAQIGAAL